MQITNIQRIKNRRLFALDSLVDKMLALVPKLRVETRERERAVLANAVQTTDRKIEDLVYDIYALTPEEIALVEGAAK